MNLLSRYILRLGYLFSKLPLRILDFCSPRTYMKTYLYFLKFLGVKFSGRPRYISVGCKFDDFQMISIGADTVVSDRVVLLTHDYSLTTGLRSIGTAPQSDVAFIKSITIADNVFIGLGSIILPGTQIGSNVIIGAGSIVRGVVPDDSIVVGNPGTVVGKLTAKAKDWEKLQHTQEIRQD